MILIDGEEDWIQSIIDIVKKQLLKVFPSHFQKDVSSAFNSYYTLRLSYGYS